MSLPRPCVASLLAAVLLVTLAAPVARAQSASAADRFLFEGVMVGKPDSAGAPPELLRFELLRADSTVVLTPLGRVDIAVGPLSGFPELPSPPDSVVPLHISARSFLTIAEQVEGALSGAPPESSWGFSVNAGRLRVELSQGIPLSAVALVALTLVAGSAGATALLLRRREGRRRELARDVRRRQIEAGEAERVRIAREIHDGPLQDLHAVRARAAAHRAVSDAGPADDAGSGAEGTVADEVGAVARELRAIAEGLRPPALGRFGLPAALASHAARVTERHPHVRVRVRADEGTPALSAAAEASLFRIAQEAVANAVRHGHARTIEVEYAADPSAETPERIRLVIRDDGAGLPSGLDLSELAAGGHFGLVGMRERAALLGGTLAASPGGLATQEMARDAGGDGHRPLGAGPGTTVEAVVSWAAVARAAFSAVPGRSPT